MIFDSISFELFIIKCFISSHAFCLMYLTCCFTGQRFKILLPEKWSSFIRDGSSQLDTLRSDEERLYSTNNTWNCSVVCCWKMWVPTSCKQYPGLYVRVCVYFFLGLDHSIWSCLGMIMCSFNSRLLHFVLYFARHENYKFVGFVMVIIMRLNLASWRKALQQH
jgi:hypothetical protein